MRGIFSFILLVIPAFPVFSQNDLKGLVSNEEGKPLAGVNIFVSEKTTGTVTDKTGHYLVKDLPDGILKIQFSHIGFNSRLESVTFAGAPVELNVTLHQEPIETHEVVVVGGYNSTQHENAVKIDVLKTDAINTSGSPNLSASLAQISGVDMISKGNGIAKPVIRGLSKNDILVLNNGVRLENYQYSDHHPLGLDEFGIESVEIIKGPASLLYGSDAIGGVMDFIREKPAPVGQIAGDFQLRLFSNSLGSHTSLGVKGASQKFFWGIRGGTKSHADYLQGGGDQVPNSRFNGWSFKADAGFKAKAGTFRLYYDAGEQNLGLTEPEALPFVTGRGRSMEVWYQAFRSQMVSSQNRFYIGKFKIEADGALQRTGLMHFDDRTDPFIEMTLSTLTYETKLYLPSVVKGDEYIVGFQGYHQQNRNRNNRETMLLPDAGIENFSGFTLLQRTFREKLKIQAGVRYDHRIIATESFRSASDSVPRDGLSTSYNSLSGSFGANYDLAEKLFLRANFSAAFRSPNLAELTSHGIHENRYELGNPDLLPQHAYESDVSAHYHLDHLSLDVAGFYNRIKDYIFITPTGIEQSPGIPVYRYIQADARLTGGEAVLHVHPKPAEWLHVETTFSYVNGRQDNGDYLPFIPACKLRFDWKAEKKKMGILEHAYFKFSLLVAMDQDNYAPEEASTPGYTLLDSGIGANIRVAGQQTEVGLSVSNLLDRKYIDHLSTLKEAGYFNPGRNIAFNLKIPFGLKNQATVIQ